jgi:membrane protease YdiL (CAAX protease family)
MNAKKQTALLFSLIILPVVILFLSSGLVKANYFFTWIYKLLYLFPIFYGLYIERKTLKQSLFENFSFRRFKKKVILMLGIGIIIAAIYVAAFFLLKGHLDLQLIAAELGAFASINLNNIIFIGISIIIVDSLLEEFFWRGFMFDRMRKLMKPWIAYLITGIAFSFHHIMFYHGWFNLTFFIIATFGLAAYAMIMNYIFQRYKDLLSCWVVHAFADIAQISIALMVFGMI